MTLYEIKKEELKKKYNRLNKALSDIKKLRSNKKPNAPKIGKQIASLQGKINRLNSEIDEIKAELLRLNEQSRKRNARPVAPMLPHHYAAMAHCGDY